MGRVLGSELVALVRAVLDAGPDALPRRIVADWLDEQGLDPLADLLRLGPSGDTDRRRLAGLADQARHRVLGYGAGCNSATGVIITPTARYRLTPGGLHQHHPESGRWRPVDPEQAPDAVLLALLLVVDEQAFAMTLA